MATRISEYARCRELGGGCKLSLRDLVITVGLNYVFALYIFAAERRFSREGVRRPRSTVLISRKILDAI